MDDGQWISLSRIDQASSALPSLSGVRTGWWSLTLSWSEQQDHVDPIFGESQYDNSGFSVSLSKKGDVVAIGAWANDGNGDNSGHVRIYHLDRGLWVQRGSDIDGVGAGDGSGVVALSSDGTK